MRGITSKLCCTGILVQSLSYSVNYFSGLLMWINSVHLGSSNILGHCKVASPLATLSNTRSFRLHFLLEHSCVQFVVMANQEYSEEWSSSFCTLLYPSIPILISHPFHKNPSVPIVYSFHALLHPLWILPHPFISIPQDSVPFHTYSILFPLCKINKIFNVYTYLIVVVVCPKV